MKADPRRARFGPAYLQMTPKARRRRERLAASLLTEYVAMPGVVRAFLDNLEKEVQAILADMQRAYLAAMATKMANGLATFQLEYTPILKTPTPEERITP